MYNADLQCRLQFNATEDTKVCSQLSEICSQLWCSLNGTCTTLLRPAAPGTNCGHHKVCFVAFLVEFGYQKKVDFSGAKIRNVSKSKTCHLLSMVAGEIGQIGDPAQGHVEPVFQCKRGSVITPRHSTVELFV
jgi:hypothetical protein